MDNGYNGCGWGLGLVGPRRSAESYVVCFFPGALAPALVFAWSDGLKSSRYLVGTTTVWSGASYIYTKDAVKILTSRKA